MNHNHFASLILLGALVGGLGACDRSTASLRQPAEGTPGNSPMVQVCLIDSDGRLTGPTATPKVVRSEAEWRSRLTPEQYRVTRHQGTEPPFCGGLLTNKEAGLYVCVGCDLPLFESKAKFESGTGWPSFFQPVAPQNILERRDTSHGMVRTEILCPRCDGHLGHVFDDGPRPTGRRYCLNSEALRFVPADQLGKLAAPTGP